MPTSPHRPPPNPALSSSPPPSFLSVDFGPSSRGARTLRWLRVLFYVVWSPIFLFAMYAQLILLKGPGRTPIPASVSFGRDSTLLTFHGNFHCTWYALLCLLHALVLLRRSTRPAPRAPSPLFLWIERVTHRYTAPLFSLGGFVCLAYYLLLHFLPVTRLRARMIPDHDAFMFLLHGGPGFFVLGDALLKDAALVHRHAMSPAKGGRAIAQYGAAYFAWSVFCVSRNGGHWPYPFQPRLTVVQHCVFVSVVLLVANYMSRYGARISGRLDRRRRRRLLFDARCAAKTNAPGVATGATGGRCAPRAAARRSARSLSTKLEVELS